jgi:hypothetical protein
MVLYKTIKLYDKLDEEVTLELNKELNEGKTNSDEAIVGDHECVVIQVFKKDKNYLKFYDHLNYKFLFEFKSIKPLKINDENVNISKDVKILLPKNYSKLQKTTGWTIAARTFNSMRNQLEKVNLTFNKTYYVREYDLKNMFVKIRRLDNKFYCDLMGDDPKELIKHTDQFKTKYDLLNFSVNMSLFSMIASLSYLVVGMIDHHVFTVSKN